MTTASITYLLVEDDEVEVRAFRRQMETLKSRNALMTAKDCMEALEILRGQKGRQPPPKPYLVLLDLNTPRLNGIEFLVELRADTELKRTTVFVLTTSNDPGDKRRAHDRGVAGYLVKGTASAGFPETVKMLEDYARLVEFLD